MMFFNRFKISSSRVDVSDSEGNRSRHLRRLQDRRPVAPTDLWSLLRNNDRIPRLQCGAQRITQPPSTRVVLGGDDRTIGSDHKNTFTIRHRSQTASLAEIPLSASSRLIADRGGVKHLAIH